jgi:GTPase SAR1 family protein
MLAEAQAIIAEITDPQTVQALTLQAQAINANLEQTQARVAIVGTKGVGKTAVVKALSGGQDANHQFLGSSFGAWSSPAKKITLLDTHHERGDIDLGSANNAEVVVLVVNGDLTASEYKFLSATTAKIIIALNKTDLLLPTDQTQILQSIHDRVSDLLTPADVVAIAAQPRPITVRQYDQERQTLLKSWQEVLPPVIAPLKERIEQIIGTEGEQLWRRKLQQQLQNLKDQAQQALTAQRRKLAEAAIARQQKIIAISLFASPVPPVDIATSLVLNSQLLLEIAQIYCQPLTFEQAKHLATDMGKQLIQLGGVEIATTTVSSFLKTNFLTYAIGGAIQAISAAYFTNICAQSFISYLEQLPLAIHTRQNTSGLIDIGNFASHATTQLSNQLSRQPLQKWAIESVPRLLTYRRHGQIVEK